MIHKYSYCVERVMYYSPWQKHKNLAKGRNTCLFLNFLWVCLTAEVFALFWWQLKHTVLYGSVWFGVFMLFNLSKWQKCECLSISVYLLYIRPTFAWGTSDTRWITSTGLLRPSLTHLCWDLFWYECTRAVSVFISHLPCCQSEKYHPQLHSETDMTIFYSLISLLLTISTVQVYYQKLTFRHGLFSTLYTISFLFLCN